MKKFFFIICLPFLLFSQEKKVTVIETFEITRLFNDNVSYNISTFKFTSPNATLHDNDIIPIRVGIITTENILVDIIWEHQPISSIDSSNIIDSIAIIDLNNDGILDITINYNDYESEFSDQLISTFIINHQNDFKEISETLVKNNYEILDNNHIRYQTPLSMFGRPYIEEGASKQSNYWVDYYEIQGIKLMNINQKYRHHYEELRKKSSEKLKELFTSIKTFKMSEETTHNQFQLEEYFNQISELKTIIYRCDKVIY